LFTLILITMTLILIVILQSDQFLPADAQELSTDQSHLQNLLSKSLDNVHHGNIDITSVKILLNGINFTQGELILLYYSKNPPSLCI
jgi:hypothetical protein